jgi:hypothetical protein
MKPFLACGGVPERTRVLAQRCHQRRRPCAIRLVGFHRVLRFLDSPPLREQEHARGLGVKLRMHVTQHPVRHNVSDSLLATSVEPLAERADVVSAHDISVEFRPAVANHLGEVRPPIRMGDDRFFKTTHEALPVCLVQPA